MSDTLMWVDTRPGMWRSVCGRYVILAATLPEDRPDPTVVYLLRKIDPVMNRAQPGRLGYLLAERPTLAQAQAEAQRDAFCQTHRHQRDVPGDYPAAALARFWWPISQGTTRGALAIVDHGHRLVAQVVGMHRTSTGYAPGSYADIDLTAATGGTR